MNKKNEIGQKSKFYPSNDFLLRENIIDENIEECIRKKKMKENIDFKERGEIFEEKWRRT